MRLKQPPPPARRSRHPDARIEAQLQQIHSYRLIIHHKEQTVAGLYRRLNRTPAGSSGTREQITSEARCMELEIIHLHSEVADLISGLGDVELSFL